MTTKPPSQSRAKKSGASQAASKKASKKASKDASKKPRGAQSRSPRASSPSAAGFAAALLAYYDADRRDLPWRRDPTAYRTLVSELMLQQTVVATVIPYFERFVTRFPDVAALAAAEEDDVLALWSGLGYYSRGRNLHRAARAVVEQHGGLLPASEEALRALPGVGPYTAAAVAAIAFGVRTFALDGNAARVMARLEAVTEPIDRPAVRARLHAIGTALVPEKRAGDFAQAVMELGARVCVPGRPRCERCPVARWCVARRLGVEATLPVRLPKAKKRVVELAGLAIARADGRVLLVRRAAGTLLGGTWTLPADEIASPAEGEAGARRAGRELGLEVGTLAAVGAIRHVFTHRDVTASVFVGHAPPRVRWPSEIRWVDPRGEGAELALSTFTRKMLALLADAPQRRARMASPSTM